MPCKESCRLWDTAWAFGEVGLGAVGPHLKQFSAVAGSGLAPLV